MKSGFDLKRPCESCPFRTDVQPYLTRKRVIQITDSLIQEQKSFTCHKTTVPSGDGDGQMVDGPNAQHCAGALIMLERLGRPNQMMRIMGRLRLYDPPKLDMASPVYATPRAMIAAQGRAAKKRAKEKVDG